MSFSCGGLVSHGLGPGALYAPLEVLWKWGREQEERERLGTWSGNKGFQGSFRKGVALLLGSIFLQYLRSLEQKRVRFEDTNVITYCGQKLLNSL